MHKSDFIIIIIININTSIGPLITSNILVTDAAVNPYAPPRHMPPSLMGFGRVLGAFQLNLKTFGAYLKAMHGLNGGLGRQRIVVRHKSEAFREIGLFVDEYFGRKDVAEWQKGREEVSIGKFLR